MSRSVEKTLQDVLDHGVILCIRLGKGARVLEACQAAARGGIAVFEVTLTTPGAIEVIGALSRDDRLVVGAGTVLTAGQVRDVAKAGGRFFLSPVFAPEVVDEAHRLGLLAIPGTATPTEILNAHRHGAKLIKVFPAEDLGGPHYIRMIRGPFPDIPLVPTGGPTAETIADYMAAGAVAVGVGREIFPADFTLDHVEAASRRVRQAMKEYRESVALEGSLAGEGRRPSRGGTHPGR